MFTNYTSLVFLLFFSPYIIPSLQFYEHCLYSSNITFSAAVRKKKKNTTQSNYVHVVQDLVSTTAATGPDRQPKPNLQCVHKNKGMNNACQANNFHSRNRKTQAKISRGPCFLQLRKWNFPLKALPFHISNLISPQISHRPPGISKYVACLLPSSGAHINFTYTVGE